MANRTQTIADLNYLRRRRVSILMAGLLLGFLTAMFLLTSVGLGQQPAYLEMETSDRYLVESTEPKLVYDQGLPSFEELSEEQIKAISASNRDASKAISDDQSKIEDLLETGGDLANPLFAEFFDGYVWAEMTQTAPEKISNLGERRTEFFKDFLSRKVTGTTRQQFIDTLIIPAVQKIYSNDKFHPAARLNAVYILGMLDTQSYNRAAGQNPTPSPEALDALITIFNSDQFPAYLKVAAIAGIQRHVETDDVVGNQLNDKRAQIAAQATAVIEGTAAGQADWDTELDYWLKRRSIQILGLLRNADALDTILKTLASTDNRLWLRFDALEAIGKLDLANLSPEKISQTSLAVSEFVTANLKNESDTIHQSLKDLIFTNMLFQDLDLEVTGTDWETDRPRPSGDLYAGGMGFDEMGMDEMDYEMEMEMDEMDMGYGMDMMGGRGMGMGMGMGFPGSGMMGQGPGGVLLPEAVVDLPNYQLNLSRRRIKALAFTAQTVLKNEGQGLYATADQATRTFIDSIVSELAQVLKDSNVGIVNLDDVPALPSAVPVPVTESVADQMAKICEKAVRNLNQKIARIKGKDTNANPLDQPADAASAVGTAPASTAAPAANPNLDGPDFGN